MSHYPTGLIFRTWKVLQSGDLKDISPKLTSNAKKPVSEFFLDTLGMPAIHALSDAGTAINDDEFLIYVASVEDGPLDCIVTNRKLIYFAEGDSPTESADGTAKEQGPELEVRTCLFAGVASFKTGLPGRSARITIERKRGNPITLGFSRDSSTAAIRFAAERFGQHWDSLQGAADELTELEATLEEPGFASRAEKAASTQRGHGPVAASVKVKARTRKARSDKTRGNPPSVQQEEETLASTFVELLPALVGFVVFVIFLMANGAPILEGGPAVMRWLSTGNSGFLIGGIAAGAIAAFFYWSWARKRK